MSYAFVSIPKENNGGRPKPKSDIIFMRLKDIKTFPDRDDKGIKIVGNLVLETSTNAIKLEVTSSTVAVIQNTEGEPDNKGTKQKIEFSRPGSDLAFEEFVENNLNEDLICIVVDHATGAKKLLGYPGNPLQFVVESTDNNEGDSNKCTFETPMRGRRIAIYGGEIPALASAVSGGGQSA
ncbi:MAG: hypothetical protein ACRDDZ_05880 [Marinifilaceae bacterium]